MSILLKACPRCGGDIELPRDVKADDPTCIQCGFEANPNAIARVRKEKQNKLVRLVVSENA